jgi:SpoVK/Ycf46/Vps4 family AAA+-type ATPase
MARSDLLINLVKAAASSDQRLLRSTVEAIVTEERAKQHNVLADSLWRTLLTSLPKAPSLESRAEISADKGREFFTELAPRRRLEDLVLAPSVFSACNQLIEEQQRADLLRSHSLEPRHRVLLVGPPGNGKTTLAEAIAEALAVPLLVVRYEAMIGSYLGETASRLKRVFDYARTRRCVLFFDEFDAVGKERGDTHETGEIKRVVTSLLMQIDDLPSYTVVVAATNHAELLDRAVWRRFQLRLNLPQPTATQLGTFIDRFFDSADKPIGLRGNTISKALGAMSYAEAEQFCLDVLRRHVLSLESDDLKNIALEQMRVWTERVNPEKEKTGGENRARPSPNKTARSRRGPAASRSSQLS